MSDSEFPHFELEHDGDVLIVIPSSALSELDEANLIAERQRLLNFVAQDETITRVLVDLRRLAYFGTMLLSTLSELWKHVSQRNGRIALCSLSEVASEAVTIAGFDRIFNICSSQGEALAGLRE